MNVVQPIRDKAKLEELKVWLRARSERNYLAVMVGINTGLRSVDILNLKVQDLDGQHTVVREKKTKKRRFITLNEDLSHSLRSFCKSRRGGEYIFQSREGVNKPLTTSMFYRILREAAEAVGIKNIGTHTLRKTFGYHMYQDTRDAQLVCQLLGHSDPAITKRYIGIEQDTMDTARRKFSL